MKYLLKTLALLFFFTIGFSIIVNLYPRLIIIPSVAPIKFINDISLKKITVKDKTMLAIGNSSFTTGILANELQNFLILGAFASSRIEHYYVLKKYLKNNPAPRIDFLSQEVFIFEQQLVFWKLYGGYFYTFGELFDIFKVGKRLNYLEHVGTENFFVFLFNAISYKLKLPNKYIGFFQKNLFSNKNNTFYELLYGDLKMNSGHSIGPFRPASIDDRKARFDELEVKRKKHGIVNDLPAVKEYYLKKIIKLAKKYNIKIIYLPAPLLTRNVSRYMHKSYFQAYDNHMNSLICKDKIFDCWVFEKELGFEYFNDPSHLNLKGARLCTDFIIDKLSRE